MKFLSESRRPVMFSDNWIDVCGLSMEFRLRRKISFSCVLFWYFVCMWDMKRLERFHQQVLRRILVNRWQMCVHDVDIPKRSQCSSRESLVFSVTMKWSWGQNERQWDTLAVFIQWIGWRKNNTQAQIEIQKITSRTHRRRPNNVK